MRTVSVVFSACVLAGGCSASYRVIQAPAVGTLTKYTSVCIPTVETESWLNGNAEVRNNPNYQKWRDELAIAATQIPADAKDKLRGAYSSTNDPVEGSFTARCELTNFNMGQGSGKAIITLKVTLVDSKSGAVIGQGEATGSASVGSPRDAFSLCARGVARFIADHKK